MDSLLGVWSLDSLRKLLSAGDNNVAPGQLAFPQTSPSWHSASESQSPREKGISLLRIWPITPALPG